jgi:hypothetical protein
MLFAPALNLLVALLWAHSPKSPRSNDFIADTGYAKYLGNQTRENTVTYLGIPYAEPPLGDLRFRAPRALNATRVAEEASGEPVDARGYPEFCVQGSMGGELGCITVVHGRDNDIP